MIEVICTLIIVIGFCWPSAIGIWFAKVRKGYHDQRTYDE